MSGGENSFLEWLAGVFARHEHLDNTCISSYGTAAGPYTGAYDREDSTVETNNIAGFGQVIYQVTPRLELTGALRPVQYGGGFDGRKAPYVGSHGKDTVLAGA